MVKQNILIVDDSEMCREMLVQMLKDEYTLFQAENGKQALDILEENHKAFRLVLLDLNMPVMDGYAVLDVMTERGWLKELPVIIISDDPGDCYKRGATDSFTKPFDPEKVNARIHNIIGLYNGYYTDNVTGGLNREGFIRQVENFLHGNPNKSLYDMMFFDIKNFKAVNELTGISNGDNVLRSFYRDLVNAKFAPVLVSRIEADHFVCLSERPADGYDCLNSLCDRRYKKNGKLFHLYAHCGIYHLEDKPMAVSGMIDRARLAEEFSNDEFLRSYYFYDSTIKHTYLGNAEISAGLVRGLENEEFKLYFQPVVDTKTGKVVSAESLIRWFHPDKGMISPAVFVPVLEKDGYISDMDMYVVRKVQSFQKKRRAEDKTIVPISVNLSRIDFYDEAMVDEILMSISSNDIPKGTMNFEITETVYAAVEESCHAVVDAIRKCGSRIFLDDFGSGYSSFGTLQDYEFDIIKIDMSFIHQIGKSPKTEIILKSIISMAHQLGLKIVAEGVETQDQLQFLRENDCDFIQGFYFYKPMEEDAFAEILDMQ